MDKQKQSPAGFALGSIEGRVAIQYFQPSAPRDNFTFKCHRSPAPVNGYYEIFPVRIICLTIVIISLHVIILYPYPYILYIHAAGNPANPYCHF